MHLTALPAELAGLEGAEAEQGALDYLGPRLALEVARGVAYGERAAFTGVTSFGGRGGASRRLGKDSLFRTPIFAPRWYCGCPTHVCRAHTGSLVMVGM